MISPSGSQVLNRAPGVSWSPQRASNAATSCARCACRDLAMLGTSLVLVLDRPYHDQVTRIYILLTQFQDPLAQCQPCPGDGGWGDGRSAPLGMAGRQARDGRDARAGRPQSLSISLEGTRKFS